LDGPEVPEGTEKWGKQNRIPCALWFDFDVGYTSGTLENSMSQANVAVVQELYAAFARGDGPAALAQMDPGIVWNEAENFPYADRNPYVSPLAVAEGVFFRLATEWDSFQALPAEILDAGETVVALGRYKAASYKKTGAPLDAQFVHVWRLRDGKITGFQQYTDTAQAQNAVQGA
jgi:ketosteroid isomerase-like protein